MNFRLTGVRIEKTAMVIDLHRRVDQAVIDVRAHQALDAASGRLDLSPLLWAST